MMAANRRRYRMPRSSLGVFAGFLAALLLVIAALPAGAVTVQRVISPLGIEAWLARLRLLAIVRPVANHLGHDVLGPRSRCRARRLQCVVGEVVVVQVRRGQRPHRGGQVQHPLAARRRHALAEVGLLDERHDITAVVVVAHGPAGVVEADEGRVEPVRIQVRQSGDPARERERPLAQ